MSITRFVVSTRRNHPSFLRRVVRWQVTPLLLLLASVSGAGAAESSVRDVVYQAVVLCPDPVLDTVCQLRMQGIVDAAGHALTAIPLLVGDQVEVAIKSAPPFDHAPAADSYIVQTTWRFYKPGRKGSWPFGGGTDPETRDRSEPKPLSVGHDESVQLWVNGLPPATVIPAKQFTDDAPLIKFVALGPVGDLCAQVAGTINLKLDAQPSQTLLNANQGFPAPTKQPELCGFNDAIRDRKPLLTVIIHIRRTGPPP